MTDGERLVRLETKLDGMDERHMALTASLALHQTATDSRLDGMDQKLGGISRAVADTAATVRAIRLNGKNGTRGITAQASLIVAAAMGLGATIITIVINWP